MNRSRLSAGIAAALAVAVLAPNAQAAAATPKIAQLVVYRNGGANQALVRAAKTTARLGKKRCAVGPGTALAALLRSGLTGVKLKDYGSCSRKPADAGGLYVSRIRRDSARGVNGWVYKVGNRVATAGAGDPTGPFGSGRLRDGARVTWFYCRMNQATQSCQRTLVAKPEALGGGQLRVTVRSYDDHGKGRPAAGATVHAGTATATTDANGVATVAATGTVPVFAQAPGTVRSFAEQIAAQ
jgi:hypothetical protein